MSEIDELKKKLELYEQNGAAKLFYALNRKANEMANLLNKTNLCDLEIDDPKNKSFDRLKTVWNDAASLSNAIKELGVAAGVTGKEDEDIRRRPFVELIADSRK